MKFDIKWIAWELTRRCNLHCVHCRSSSEVEVKNHPDFTTEYAFKVLDDLADFAKPVLVLSGGEPLLRHDVFDIAAYGTKKGFRVCLATNGTFVTPKICEQIKASGIRMVSLSLDGSTAEVHDDFRQQPGAFQATLRATRYFNESGIKFLINSSFTAQNQIYIPETYQLAKKLGSHAWYLFMVVPTGRGEELLKELIAVDDYQEVLDWHYEMEKSEDEMLVRPICAPHYYRIRFEHNKKRQVLVKSRPLTFSPGGSKGCLAGQTIALIDVDSNVLPCSYLPLSAGNLHEKSFRDIWENSPLLKNFRDFSSYKGRCGECEYIKICGGCRARAHSIHGDYLEADPFCNYVPKRMRGKKESEMFKGP